MDLTSNHPVCVTHVPAPGVTHVPALHRSAEPVPSKPRLVRCDRMARKRCRRYNEPGRAHELTFSCYRRLPLLSRDRTREWLIEAIQAARAQERFDLWAYVVMPEHVHIL